MLFRLRTWGYGCQWGTWRWGVFAFGDAIDYWWGVLSSEHTTPEYQECIRDIFWDALNGYPADDCVSDDTDSDVEM